MEGNPLAQLPTSLDAIREMPLIEGTGADISVLGKDKPTFYIEHRKVQDIAELQQLNPSEIKNVEILAKPGLKYEKESDAVIIIHLKRRNPWLAGYVSGTGSVAETLSGYANTKLSYTFLNGLSLYADANGTSNGYRVKTAYGDRYALDNVSSDTHGTSKARNKNFNVNVGGSKDFKKGHSVGARYSYTRTPSSLLTSDANNLSINSLDTQNLSTSTRTSQQSWRHYANAYTSLQLSKPLVLTADADYLWGKAPSHTAIVERTGGQEPWLMNTSNLKDYKMATAKADLEGSWNNWSLQTGVNYSFTKNGLAFDSQASDGNTLFLSADDSEQQNLYAVYGTAAWQVNEHWALSAGVRCEVTDFDYKQDNEEVAGQSKNYVDWLPEVGVSYMYKEMMLGLTYDSKAYRPTYSDLNNNYTYITHTSWSTGNPLLKSNIIRNLEASLSPEQCMDYSLHFDFRFKKDNGAYMVHHTFTTLSLTAEGRPHLLLCTISLSSQMSCGHVIMLNRNSRKYMEYNDGIDRWERGELPLLTEHERCILYLSTLGNTVPCIARRLCKSENTVKTCKRKLFQKLGVNSISAAISYAANYQLL